MRALYSVACLIEPEHYQALQLQQHTKMRESMAAMLV